MLRSKIERRQSGILLYGITPPKSGHDPEKLREIAGRQLERIGGLDIDGLVLYDIQDESTRNAAPRPFPFMETIDPWTYSRDYLAGLDLPKIVYNGVGRYTPDSFRSWMDSHCNELDFMVLVGSPSRQKEASLSLSDAYTIQKSIDTRMLLGGVTISERHAKKSDEHLRVVSKTASGCSFFISQCVYHVENAVRFMTDYCDHLKLIGAEPIPVIFTITPCGSAKTLQFMEWLGIEIPLKLRQELATADNMLSRSVEVCRTIIDELIERATALCVPIGFNVESVAIRRDEIEASLDLVRYIAHKWHRTGRDAHPPERTKVQ